MSSVLYKIQSLPEHKRYVVMYALLGIGALIVFGILGISINNSISENGDTRRPFITTESPSEASAVSPVQGFFGSFASLKRFLVDENTVEREKHGFSQIGLIGREYAKSFNNGIDRLGNYIYEHWLTKKIEE